MKVRRVMAGWWVTYSSVVPSDIPLLREFTEDEFIDIFKDGNTHLQHILINTPMITLHEGVQMVRTYRDTKKWVLNRENNNEQKNHHSRR